MDDIELKSVESRSIQPESILSFEDPDEEPPKPLVDSMIQLVHKPSKRIPPNSVILPEWAVILGSMGIAYLAIVFACAFIFINQSKRPGLYLESCSGRSCEKSLNLKCINSICNCTGQQYYLKKCNSKKGNLEKCHNSNECLSSENFICFNGKCQCKQEYYWIGHRCAKRVTYGEICSSDDQCLTKTQMLTCDKLIGLCTCPENRFWSGFSCTFRRSYGQSCSYSNDCSETLSCIGNICSCPSSQYFDPITKICIDSFNATCSSNSSCPSSLGLSCQNGRCSCDTSKYYWSYASDACTSYCPSTWVYFNGSCFEFTSDSKDYDDAQSKCLIKNATLAIVTDSIYDYFNTSYNSLFRNNYVGGELISGVWKWINNSVIASNWIGWCGTTPITSCSYSSCCLAQYSTSSCFYGVSCSDRIKYICQRNVQFN